MELLDNILPEPNSGCWLWMRSCTSAGYGQITFRGRTRYAHRVSAYLYLGLDINDSDQVAMHKCDTRCCVNPNHLKIGDVGDNNYDMRKKGRSKGRYSDVTHCVNGHELDNINTYWIRGRRQCRACKASNCIKYRALKKALVLQARGWYERD